MIKHLARIQATWAFIKRAAEQQQALSARAVAGVGNELKNA